MSPWTELPLANLPVLDFSHGRASCHNVTVVGHDALDVETWSRISCALSDTKVNMYEISDGSATLLGADFRKEQHPDRFANCGDLKRCFLFLSVIAKF